MFVTYSEPVFWEEGGETGLPGSLLLLDQTSRFEKTGLRSLDRQRNGVSPAKTQRRNPALQVAPLELV
jgi:hypothetical protein